MEMEDVCQACGGNTLVRDLEAKPANTVWSWFPAPCMTSMSQKSCRRRKRSSCFPDSPLATKARRLLRGVKFETKQAFPSKKDSFVAGNN